MAGGGVPSVPQSEGQDLRPRSTMEGGKPPEIVWMFFNHGFTRIRVCRGDRENREMFINSEGQQRASLTLR